MKTMKKGGSLMHTTVLRHLLPCLLMIALLGTLSGCAGFLNPGPPPTRLQIIPPLPGPSAGKPLDRQLIVSLPVAGRALDSDSISLVFHGREVRKLADARWTDSAPTLVQRTLIKSFAGVGILRGVSDESAGIMADARLMTDLTQFGFVYPEEGGVPTAVFEGTFRLLSSNTGRLLGTKTVRTEARAVGTQKLELVDALEQAFGEALAEVTPWGIDLIRLIR